MKYSAQSDGEWLWIAEDSTSTGVDFDEACEDMFNKVLESIYELKDVLDVIDFKWRDDVEAAKTGAKVEIHL